MRTVIITGGAGGMGYATAEIMGRDHRVVVADLDQARVDDAVEKLTSQGVDASGFACDITDRAAVDALVAVGGGRGQVRAIVHAAGVSPQMGSPEMIIRINALGTVHVSEAALAVATEGFALVNVASIAGHMSPSALMPRRAYRLAMTDPAALTTRLTRAANRSPRAMRAGSAYSISKNFVIWYTERMAAAFGEHSARVVSVSPGSFDTAMGRLEEKSGSGKLLNYAALGRFGRPEEVGEVLAFCASDKPGYLTGVDILVDGGTKAGLTLRGMLAMARGQ